MCDRTSEPRPKLSGQAQRLLGHLLTQADGQGAIEVPRSELAKALRVSVPTITRALRELRDAGELEMMGKGGGRGRPSRYRITALCRKQVPAPSPRTDVGGGEYPKPGHGMGDITPKPDQADPDREPDLQAEAIRTLAADLGQTMVTGAAGFLQGAARAWQGLPTWQRAVLAGFPLSTVGMLVGRKYGGKLGLAIGGGIGALAGVALALFVFPDNETAVPASRSTSPGAMELGPNHLLLGYLAHQARQN